MKGQHYYARLFLFDIQYIMFSICVSEGHFLTEYSSWGLGALSLLTKEALLWLEIVRGQQLDLSRALLLYNPSQEHLFGVLVKSRGLNRLHMSPS